MILKAISAPSMEGVRYINRRSPQTRQASWLKKIGYHYRKCEGEGPELRCILVISGVFFTGPPYRILKAWREEKSEVDHLTDQFLLPEMLPKDPVHAFQRCHELL